MAAAIISCLTGLWLMISPAVFTMDKTTSNNNHIIGPLVITFSVISLWNINRNVIKANILVGAWLFISLFVLNFEYALPLLSNGFCAVLLILLAFVKRTSPEKFGGGWRSLFQHDPLHLRQSDKDANYQ